MTAAKQEPRFGIGAVAQQTGLTDHTIRAWERRYGAVVAGRAANGRRVYSGRDVEKLGLLKRLTDRGESIGQIADHDIDELRARARVLDDCAGATAAGRIRLAILGDFLPGELVRHERDLAPLEVAVSDSSRDRFVADLRRQQAIDAVILESPVLDDDVVGRMREYMEQAGAASGVIVYRFGRSGEVDRARDSRIVVLRSPIDAAELRAAVMRSVAPAVSAPPARQDVAAAADAAFDAPGTAAPRRFSNLQLAALAQASTAIDCECPHHLAQLVADLTAFEIYSANCANRDEEDAALHRYLHRTTAAARALIETALERVADAEGIDY